MRAPDRKLGNTGKLIAPVSYGCMGQTHSYGSVQNKEDMIDLMRYAKETGYTMFDTAPAYGDENERFLGEAVKPFRDDVIIATKFGILHMSDKGGDGELSSSHDSILKQVDESLERLGTDHIDLYYQHRIDPKVSPEEVAETMKELHQAGKILSWGVSFAPIDYIRRAHAVFPLAAIENMYNFVDRDDEKDCFPLCEELGLLYVSACPLAKGLLSGTLTKDTQYRQNDWRSRMALFNDETMDQNQILIDMISDYAAQKNATPAQIALSWEIHQRPFIVPIPGTTKKHRVKENFDSVFVDLSEEEMNTINAQLKKMNTVGMHGASNK
ncbi:MAG TPA: aldo/keto reductase [Erysipelotrichaceae bacterium]|nr:aldo/keto reductase [Erysipelotrichaceae bacterium]